MDKAYFVNESGGVDKLAITPIEVSSPKANEVLLRQTAFGVNFLDIYHRQGLYNFSLPFIPGVEGVGLVEAIGPQVNDICVGDRIAYTGYIGGYTTRRILPEWRAIKIPDSLTDQIVAANLLRVYTAHMLLEHVYRVKSGDILLIHAASGGLGTVLVPYAKSLGAYVIGTVSNEEKAEKAKLIGVDKVLIGRGKDFTNDIMKDTNCLGVDYIIDGIGGDSFYQNFSYLKRFGLLASIGWIAGQINQLDIASIKQGIFARPSAMSFCAHPESYRKSAASVFRIFEKFLTKTPPNIFSFDRLNDAHTALENGGTSGGICVVTEADSTH